MSEVLHNAIKEDGKNDTLFTYLETAFNWLDHHEETSNFHLIFLLQLTRYLGFYPQNSSEYEYFELTEGVFIPFESASCLSKEQTTLFKSLIDLKFEDDQKIFTGFQRQILLNILIDYYSLNIEGFKKPKSLSVLKEVFS
ncbi:DNA repair protein RecO [Flavobacterium haoranii]|uniref:DNA repair protein RecO n=1 Tax=Flavobacterium haoranii TaxID=683124 RepID=UPI002938D3A4|nr:DNA repair protein RecO C-terminal domain-containing protein [Flavobacterium haoranii]